MTIKVGDKLPQSDFLMMTADGTQKVSTDTIFSGRKVVLFAVPGAFTPTCSMNYLPGFVQRSDAIKAKGIDAIACVAVNDVHVMSAWGKHAGCDGRVMMLADGNGDFARKLGLEVDLATAGMGRRSRRYSMVVDDGVVRRSMSRTSPASMFRAPSSVLQQL